MINKDKHLTQYKLGNLVCLLSPKPSLLETTSRKFRIIYVGLLLICKIVDRFQYILMNTKGKILNGIFSASASIFENSESSCEHTSKIKTNNKCRATISAQR